MVGEVVEDPMEAAKAVAVAGKLVARVLREVAKHELIHGSRCVLAKPIASQLHLTCQFTAGELSTGRG